MTALFVTGTDTGVGKTVVAAALLAAARSQGLETVGIKVAESGCERGEGGELQPADAALLALAAGHEVRCPFRYELPLAPSIAAAESNTPPVELAPIRALLVGAASADLVLVEGAGGLLVPLAPDLLVSDLVRELDLPLLLVARDGLGTINHTALTIEVARARGLRVEAFLFSATDLVDEERARSNANSIKEITGARYAGRLPRLNDPLDLRELAAAGHRLTINAR